MAGENFELYSLTSKLTLDASQFDRVYGESRKKVATLADDFKRIETASHGLGTKITQTLRPSLGGLQSSISGLGGPLDSTIGKMSSMADVGNKLRLTTSGLGLGFGIVATAGIAAAGGIFALTKRAAEAGDEIYDLSQKVNFTAETISTLKNEGQLAGVEFQSIGASLGIFAKNAELANEGDKRLSAAFKVLHVDLGNNETALRDTFKALLAVKDENQQVALSMLIFGKAGKEVLGIIHSMNGDIDGAIEKFRKMGSLITTESAKAANEFSDKLKILEQRFDGVTRSIGERFMPIVTEALDKVSDAMDQNSQHAQTWADDLVAAAEFAAAQVKHILEGLAIVMEGYRKTFGKGSFFGDMVEGETKPRMLSIGGNKVMNLKTHEVFTVDDQGQITSGTGYQELGIQVRGGDTGEYAIAGGAGEYSVGAGPGGTKKKSDRLGITRGGGGGGGKGKGEDPAKIEQQVAKLRLDATIAGLKSEQDANKRSLELRRKDFNEYAAQYMTIENRRHAAVLAGLDAEQRAAEKLPKGKAVALQEIANKRTAEATEHEQNRNRVLDERGRILDQIDNFLRDQDRSINSLTASTDQWDDAYQQLVDTLKEEGVTLEETTRQRIESNMARAKELELVLSVTRARVVANTVRDRFVTKEGKERPPWIDLGGGSTVGGEPATTGRPRVATVDEIVKREKEALRRERITEIATDLTFTIGSAIEEGFRHGVKAGIKEFEIGMLEMLKSAALNALEKRIEKLLGGGQNSDQDQGGGGLWSTIAHFGISAIGALFGGGGSEGGAGSAAAGAIGGFAGGGYVPPDTYYWRGEHGPELVKSGSSGDSVMSHSDSLAFAGAMAGGGMNVNIYAQDISQAFSRQTMTQAKSKLRRLQRGR